MKRKPTDLTKEETISTLDALYTSASLVRGRDAMKLFLKDLLTRGERVMLGRRILIAQMILRGLGRDEIISKLKVGPDTIFRVKRWLDDTLPGYEKAIKEMEAEYERRRKRREYAALEPFSYAWMKRRYPLHFLLFPAPKKKSK